VEGPVDRSFHNLLYFPDGRSVGVDCKGT
jgi:hypothetical protein